MSPPSDDASLARAARDCPALAGARALSAWVGSGRPVTATGVLRRADVGQAAAAAGLPDPGRVRSAGDVPALHRPWVAAQAAGLLTVVGDRAVAAPPVGDDPVGHWLRALRAVLASESGDRDRVGAAVLVRAVLDVLRSAEVRDVVELERRLTGAVTAHDPARAVEAFGSFRRELHPAHGALAVLAGFDAVRGLRVTALGLRAHRALVDDIGAAAPPELLPSAHGERSVSRLRIGLQRVRPPVWRRVLVPSGAHLGDLHDVIQVVMDWDDDHLHVFTASGRQYADAAVGIDGCADESTRTLAEVLRQPGASLTYTYDLGDCWDHTVLLEEVLDRDDGATYPVCVGGRGDAPVEDWLPEDGEPTTPFDREELDQRLAALGAARRH